MKQLEDLKIVLNFLKHYLGVCINNGCFTVNDEEFYRDNLDDLFSIYGIENYDLIELQSNFREVRYKLSLPDFKIHILIINEYESIYSYYGDEYYTNMYIVEEEVKTVLDVRVIEEI